jgi:hypothetical protein
MATRYDDMWPFFPQNMATFFVFFLGAKIGPQKKENTGTQ